ncbi:hypothetical protein [Microbacterium sp. NPDC087592]|uniref:hypothetical protein n=1 Tax=Microbacterium sp. NPDC087592 TaxID=3364193 RepID=UPI003815C259
MASDNIMTRTRSWRRAVAATAAAVIAVALCVVAPSLAATAAVTSSGPVFTHAGYDYAPTVIEENGVRKMWWCGEATTDGYLSDAIFYREQNISTGSLSPIQQVLTPRPSIATWDKSYICDPSVVKGSFTNPDDGKTYTYALYYTATDRGPGNPAYYGTHLDGTNNRIGVAWSNDGVAWKKYSQNPVISPRVVNTDAYGAGQATSYNAGGSSVRVTYHDNSTAGTSLYTRTSTNGRTFGAETLVSLTGLAPSGQLSYGSNFDVAYKPSEGMWYGTFPLPRRDAGDRETYRMVIAKIPAASFPSGTWQKLGFIDSNRTGAYLNHSPGIARTGSGEVSTASSGLTVLYSGGANSPGTWDLRVAKWSATPATAALNRYYNAAAVRHQVTTGPPTGGGVFEETLGYLPQAPTGSAVPLYGCKFLGEDYFVALDENCEGHSELGINGYIYPSAPTGVASKRIYRCYTGQDHFVSDESNCEGVKVEAALGFILVNP